MRRYPGDHFLTGQNGHECSRLSTKTVHRFELALGHGPPSRLAILPDADRGDVGSGEKPDDRERQRESDAQRTADDQRKRQKQT